MTLREWLAGCSVLIRADRLEAAVGLISQRESEGLVMDRLRDVAVIVVVAAVVAFVAGCEKGPMQKAGERVDRALDQDRALGKGPVEKAGKKVDKAVDEVKR
jgi:hypothetical protein